MYVFWLLLNVDKQHPQSHISPPNSPAFLFAFQLLASDHIHIHIVFFTIIRQVIILKQLCLS